MFGITFHDQLYGSWDQAKGYLVEELQQLHAVLDRRVGSFLANTSRGAIVVGNATGNEWTALPIGAADTVLRSDGVDPSWQKVVLSTDVTGTLGVTHGGTGLATVSQGDIFYGSATDVISRLAKDTNATRYLSNTGTGNNPAWAQVALATGVSGTLPVTNGGTGTATAFTAGSVVFAGVSGVYSQDNANLFWDDSNNRLGIGTNSPTAGLHIRAGSTAASSAPIKLVSGTVMTTAEAGAIEFTTDDLFFTITTAAARKGIILDNGSRLTSGKIPIATTNGRLIDLTPSSAYTVTNGTTDRSYDADSYTGDEIADVLYTLITDLQAKGILG